MKVKILKKHENAVIPSYAHATDAGFDLTAVSCDVDSNGNIVYGTGLAFEIPEGYVGLLFPRSSNCKKDLILSNCVGVIDSGYRGEVSFKFKPLNVCIDKHSGVFQQKVSIGDVVGYSIGDRIGQMIIMPYPHIEFEEVDKLSESDRGENGYGSTDWKEFEGSPEELVEIEKEAIRKALVGAGGDLDKAAAFLQVSKRTLYRKAKQYNII